MRCAVQLLAVSSVLAEVELWPSLNSVRRSTIQRTEHGPRVVLAGPPLELDRLYRRVGGGAARARRIRDRLVAEICRRCQIPEEDLVPGSSESGFLLDPSLLRALELSGSPVDDATARALWSISWNLPRIPQAGGVVQVPVADLRLARRIAVATAVELWQRSVPSQVHWQDDGDEALEIPKAADGVTLIVAGDLGESELMQVERWLEQGGSRALAIGRFQPGWQNQAPKPGWRLLLVGGSREHCHQQAQRLAVTFDPGSRPARDSLTIAARSIFKSDVGGAEVQAEGLSSPLGRLLGLQPQGLPVALLEELLGLEQSRLQLRCEMLGAVRTQDDESGLRGWRLEPPPPMVRDAFHHEITQGLSAQDPRRLRHELLAGGDPAPLIEWCRARQCALEGQAIRDLLSPVDPGELPDEVLEGLIEARLMDLDLVGARSAVAVLAAERRGPWLAWLESLDSAEDWTVTGDELEELRQVPAAAASVAIRACRRKLGDATSKTAQRVLAESLERLTGRQKMYFEIEAASALHPNLLDDRAWRRRFASSGTRLRCRVLHRWAVQLQKRSQQSRVRRILRQIARLETLPAWLGLIQFDLGVAEDDCQSPDLAFLCFSRALRLLSAAGLRYKLPHVEFNLAVMDIDHLRVESAAAHLDRAATTSVDPWLMAERARLSLAVGDEEGLRRVVADLAPPGPDDDLRWCEAYSLLSGILALLDGQTSKSIKLFLKGGDEGKQWLALALACGCHPSRDDTELPISTRTDPWGLDLAASMMRNRAAGDQAGGDRSDDVGSPDLRGSMALALYRRLIGPETRYDAQLPWSKAAAVLAEAGLEGWARLLRTDVASLDQILDVLIKVAEGGGPQQLKIDDQETLLAGLGVHGLEIRSALDGRELWRVGEGTETAIQRRGDLELVALGAEPSKESVWRLLHFLLDRVVDPGEAEQDASIVATGVFGVSDGARRLREQLQRLAPMPVPVLLLGETGVGKDVAAKALHRLSGRSGQMVSVNVAAVPDNLFEAEFFGSVRGAFTGADQNRPGLVDQADQGTLFLDEIGDLNPLLQVKLLRFLESGEARSVGSVRAREVDVRIIAATHQNLKTLVDQGDFRQDLYFRIAAFPIPIPPLRERREDIPILRNLFEQASAPKIGRQPSRWSLEAENALFDHQWPGNIRELKNAVTAAQINAQGRTVQVADLRFVPTRQPLMKVAERTWDGAIRRFKRDFLLAALERNSGNRSATARELGVSRQALLYQIKTLGLTDS